MDFTRDSLTQRLTAGGFDMTAKSFFSWLGVTYYLSAEAIGKTLAELSSLCADGSTLVFDYLDENFFDAPERRVQNTVMMAKAGGEPMQSAFFRRLSLIISFTRAHTSCMPCVPEYSNRLSLWGLECRSMSMPSV